jgi:hypothetical protein
MITKSDHAFFSAFLENTEKVDAKISTFEIVTKGNKKTFRSNSKTLFNDVQKFTSGKEAIEKAKKQARELMKPTFKINQTRFNFPVMVVTYQKESLK